MFKVGDRARLIKYWSDSWPLGYIFTITGITNADPHHDESFPDTTSFLRGKCCGKEILGAIMDNYCEPYEEFIIKEEKDYYTWLAKR